MRKTFGSHKHWRNREYESDGLDVGYTGKPRDSSGKKLAYLAIALLMLVIGLAGIIIPIIPGLLFLAVALFYLGKVFPSIKSMSDNHPILGKVNDRFDQMASVKIWDRIRVAALMSVEALASTISALVSYGAGKLGKRKSSTNFGG